MLEAVFLFILILNSHINKKVIHIALRLLLFWCSLHYVIFMKMFSDFMFFYLVFKKFNLNIHRY